MSELQDEISRLTLQIVMLTKERDEARAALKKRQESPFGYVTKEFRDEREALTTRITELEKERDETIIAWDQCKDSVTVLMKTVENQNAIRDELVSQLTKFASDPETAEVYLAEWKRNAENQQARAEKAEAWKDGLEASAKFWKSRNEKAEAACAEMREALDRVGCRNLKRNPTPMDPKNFQPCGECFVCAPLSSSCGSRVLAVVEAARKRHETCKDLSTCPTAEECFVCRCGDLGISNTLHDLDSPERRE